MCGTPWLYGRNWSRIEDSSARRDERPLSVTKKTDRIRMKTVMAEENGPAVCPSVSGVFPLPTNALLEKDFFLPGYTLQPAASISRATCSMLASTMVDHSLVACPRQPNRVRNCCR